MDIAELVELGRKGEGCSLKVQLESMDAGERLNVMRGIAAQSKVDSILNPVLPQLTLQTWVSQPWQMDFHHGARLTIGDSSGLGIAGLPLVTSELELYSGEIRILCSDYRSSKRDSK